MMFPRLPSSEIELLADWLESAIDRDVDDNGALPGETPGKSARITIAAREMVRAMRDELSFLNSIDTGKRSPAAPD